ncbi:MAG: YaeQ family protein [Planctomycetes bacterium]|jgi:uncharacterized protein YaeQ|nr:YaeQ family protein [Planctomycetota bacterium]MCL4729721.1 YaeQ family protein [Planctomycetota bacterium]
MARLNVDLSVNDYDRGLFETRKLVLELRENEGMRHLVLKILAMALYFDRKLQVEPGMDEEERYEPDLLLRGDDHRPLLWVECGQCRVQKLDKITFRHYDARVIMMKATEREANDIAQRCRGEVRRLSAIEFVGFDPGFVEALGETLTGRNDIITIISGHELQVVAGGTTLRSTIHRVRGEP